MPVPSSDFPRFPRCSSCGDLVEFDAILTEAPRLDAQDEPIYYAFRHANCVAVDLLASPTSSDPDWHAMVRTHVNKVPFLREFSLQQIEQADAAAVEWTAGWNMPGYLPESDPETFESWDDARDYIVDAISRFWDQDADAYDGMTNDASSDARWLPVDTAINSATHNEVWSATTGDGHLRLWIVPADNTEFNIAGGF